MPVLYYRPYNYDCFIMGMEHNECLNNNPPKIILPGEYGYSLDGRPIGTFAVGSKDGCRGYLVYDQKVPMAGLAHVDYLNLDNDIVLEMISRLGELGCSDLVLASSPNSLLSSIEVIIGLPTFIFDPVHKRFTATIPQDLMRSAYYLNREVRTKRLKVLGSPLIHV